MATTLSDYDFSKHSQISTKHHTSSYPWDAWLDGRIWRLSWRQDFTPHPLMMERIIRSKGSTVKAKLSIRHEPTNGEAWGHIVLQNRAACSWPAPIPHSNQCAIGDRLLIRMDHNPNPESGDVIEYRLAVLEGIDSVRRRIVVNYIDDHGAVRSTGVARFDQVAILGGRRQGPSDDASRTTSGALAGPELS